MQQPITPAPAPFSATYYDRIPVPSPWRGKLADLVELQKRLKYLR
jgi:hypothetical protein